MVKGIFFLKTPIEDDKTHCNQAKNENTSNQNNLEKPNALQNRAYAYHKQGDLENAKRLYIKSIESGHLYCGSFLNIGCIYLDNQELDEAIFYYNEALKLKPDYHLAYINLSVAYSRKGNQDQALSTVLQALKIKPNDSDCLMNIGSIYKDMSKLELALKYTLESNITKVT